MTDDTNEGTWVLNRATGRYESIVKLEVEKEIMDRRIFRELSEDAGADLTNPQALVSAAARATRVNNWLGVSTSHVRVTAYTPPLPPVPPVPPVQQVAVVQRPPTQAELLKDRLRLCARVTPPHLWEEQCRTELVSKDIIGEKAYADLSRLRSDEKKMLRVLYQEWENGTFVLDEEAEEQERLFREQSAREIQERLGLVAESVNGSRLR